MKQTLDLDTRGVGIWDLPEGFPYNDIYEHIKDAYIGDEFRTGIWGEICDELEIPEDWYLFGRRQIGSRDLLRMAFKESLGYISAFNKNFAAGDIYEQMVPRSPIMFEIENTPVNHMADMLIFTNLYRSTYRPGTNLRLEYPSDRNVIRFVNKDNGKYVEFICGEVIPNRMMRCEVREESYHMYMHRAILRVDGRTNKRIFRSREA